MYGIELGSVRFSGKKIGFYFFQITTIKCTSLIMETCGSISPVIWHFSLSIIEAFTRSVVARVDLSSHLRVNFNHGAKFNGLNEGGFSNI
jgi:hypothetical protein